MRETPWPTTVFTPRLRLRPPTLADADFFHRVHTDPRLYARPLPATRADRDATTAELATWIEHWDGEGYGYWVVEGRGDRRPLGFGGVRRDGVDLNLYFRLVADAHGRGYGRELARAATVWAAEWLPSRRVHVLTRFGNASAIRAALAAGLSPTDDPATVELDASTPSGSRFGRWAGPLVVEVDRGGVAAGHDRAAGAEAGPAGAADGLRAVLHAAWGADAAADAEAVLAAVTGGTAALAVLDRFDGEPLGAAAWLWGQGPRRAHTARLAGFGIVPEARGRNLGRILLAGMHGLARRRGGIDLLGLDDASGVEAVATPLGYVEVGRRPGWVRVSPGTARDEVMLMRRLDGEPLAGAADDPGRGWGEGAARA